MPLPSPPSLSSNADIHTCYLYWSRSLSNKYLHIGFSLSAQKEKQKGSIDLNVNLNVLCEFPSDCLYCFGCSIFGRKPKS